MTRAIELSQGYVAYVDDADFDWLSAFNWSPLIVRLGLRERVYATNRVRVGGKQKHTLMHRKIMGAGKGEFVDHINGDELDNRRSNLRICTRSQNQYNRKKNKGETSSIYKGVHWSKGDNRWRAKAGKQHIGNFEDEVEAALAYDEFVEKHWGDFASKNFGQKKNLLRRTTASSEDRRE